MAQNQDTVADSSCMISDEDCNGLRICNRDISIELITIIFCYLDRRTLLICQLVCKHWKMVIQNYVWWKKAGLVLNKLFSRRKEIPWKVFYLICKTKPPFERKNLLKNHSGEKRLKYWKIFHYSTSINPLITCWKIENPPSGVTELPLTEPLFEGNQYCFATFRDIRIHSELELSDPITNKIQRIHVVSEGFDPYILDVLQPPIMISEWYCCQKNFPAVYECKIELLSRPKTRSLSDALDRFQFRDVIEGEKLGKWQYMSHVFTNYGCGLRWIMFMHNGAYHLPIKDPIYYGCKMAGACVRIMIP